MAKLPYMKLYINDLLGDTSGLSHAEMGLYVRIFVAMFKHGGFLSMKQIKQIGGKNFERLWPQIVGYFLVDGAGNVTQSRVATEVEKAASYSATQSAKAHLRHGHEAHLDEAHPRGASSTGVKSLKNNDTGHAGADKARALHIHKDYYSSLRKEGTAAVPSEVWAALAAASSADFALACISPASWADVPEKTLTPATLSAFDKIRREPRLMAELKAQGVTLQPPLARTG